MKRIILLSFLALAVSAPVSSQNVPEITSVSPYQNEVGVQASQDILIYFNTRINETTLNSSTIIVYGGMTGYHSGAISYVDFTNRATFNPDVDFAHGEVVTVSVTTGVRSIFGFYMTDNFAYNFIVGGAGGSGTFGAAQPESRTDSKPEGIRAADLDGDSDIDLITKRVSPDMYILTTWSNDGSGDFTGANHQTNDANDALYDLTPVDIDWDGNIDVLVEFLDWSNYQSFQLAALFPPLGTTIYPSYLAGATSGGSGYAAADLNGDGDQDVVQTFYDDLDYKVMVLTNNGSGTLSQTWESTVPDVHSFACTADFNNDGQIDFATINSADNLIAIWMNSGGAVFVSGGTFSAGYAPTDVYAADLNGDGAADIFTINRNSDNLSVLFNGGAGTFGTAESYDVGDDPTSLAAADLDDDGDIDLATANSDSYSVSVLLNDGSGDFGASRTDYTSGTSTRPPGHIAAADFDGDGDIDLATSNGGYYSNYIYILFNMTQPQIVTTSPYQNELNVDSAASISVVFDVAMSGSTFNASSFVVDARSTGPHTGSFSYNSTSRTATFNPTEDFDDGELVMVNLTSDIESAEGVPIRPYGWSFTVVAEKGSGRFAAGVEYGTGTLPRYVYAADFNGDNHIDMAVANRNTNNVSVLLNNGDGTYASRVNYAVGIMPLHLFAADLNGDGHVDLAVANSSDADVSILFNNGNGTFAARVDYPVYPNPYSMGGGDLDGDGDIDLLAGSTSSVSVILNNGDGTFAANADYPAGGLLSRVYVFDYDNDGDLDVAGARNNEDVVTILSNNGNGAMTVVLNCSTGDQPNNVCAADLDNDGDLDMSVTNRADNTISVIKNNGDCTFAAQTIYSAGPGPVEVVAADFDADGDLDLATTNYSSDNVSVLLNDGEAVYASGGTMGVGDGPFGLFSADLDGNGTMDLAATNLSDVSVSVLLNFNAVFVTLPVPSIGVDMTFFAAEDTFAIMNFTSETLDSVSIGVFHNQVPGDIPAGTDWVRRYFVITPYPPGATFEVDMTLFYDQAEFDGSGLAEEWALHPYRYDDAGSAWEMEDGTVDSEENSIACAGITEFSTWGFSDSEVLTGDEQAVLPAVTTLYQNWPNPFNPVTRINYYLSHDSHVKLSVYDVLGREVTVLVNMRQEKGHRTVSWNGANASGRRAASGVYFYRLVAGDFKETRKMILIR